MLPLSSYTHSCDFMTIVASHDHQNYNSTNPVFSPFQNCNTVLPLQSYLQCFSTPKQIRLPFNGNYQKYLFCSPVVSKEPMYILRSQSTEAGGESTHPYLCRAYCFPEIGWKLALPTKHFQFFLTGHQKCHRWKDNY